MALANPKVTAYSEYARVYDQIFPFDARKFDLIKAVMPGGPLLDLGCATGSYVRAFLNDGIDAMGVDLDPEMILLAKQKAREENLHATYVQADMLDMMFNQKFKGIFSIGNTLVHLPSKDAISRMLQKLHDWLDEDGTCLIQIINYDRVLAQHITELPEINNGDLRFTRRYIHQAHTIDFHTHLYYRDISLQSQATLIPLRSHEMRYIIEKAGFRDIRMYGDFLHTPFEAESSMILIAVVHR
ncbi:MAG: class I SAM-dependent methyltransferase [Candidatus Izemoplasmatales bacterium]|jgi:cyclopropane fatty-acyl-phospholipid synthase-like methyltransferase